MSTTSDVNPIYADSNVSSKDFEFLENNELYISDIFATVQGEGPFAGRRCVFIRLAGCNYGAKGVGGIGCPWCDTDFRMDKAERMTFGQIMDKVIQIHPESEPSRRFCVITGGEPMLQSNLHSFLRYGLRDVKFQIETNGTHLQIIPSTNVHLVVSPKIPVLRGSDKAKHAQYPNLPRRVLERADCLKFVVSANPNDPYFDVPTYADRWMQQTGKPVYVSPIAVYKGTPPSGGGGCIFDPDLYDQGACADNHKRAYELAMARGFRVSVQQHLFMAAK